MSFALLALICTAALAGPLISLQPAVRVPVVTGELAVGVVLGPSGLRLLDGSEPTFAFLAGHVGFALVMFVAGSHVPMQSPTLRAGLRPGASAEIELGVRMQF